MENGSNLLTGSDQETVKKNNRKLYLKDIITINPQHTRYQETEMRKVLSITVAALLTLSTNAIAEGTKIGVDYLMLNSEIDTVDFDTSAVQIRVSSAVNKNLDLEGAMALGISDDTYNDTDPFFLGDFSVTAKLSSMLGVFAKAHSDLESRFQVFGRVGLARVEVDLDFDTQNLGSTSESYDDTGIAFGIGGSFDVSETAAIVAEYAKWPDVDFEGTNVDTEVISIGFQIAI
jgi:opacity protein-like surface antigen